VFRPRQGDVLGTAMYASLLDLAAVTRLVASNAHSKLHPGTSHQIIYRAYVQRCARLAYRLGCPLSAVHQCGT
jgi:hypothetical protein